MAGVTALNYNYRRTELMYVVTVMQGGAAPKAFVTRSFDKAIVLEIVGMY